MIVCHHPRCRVHNVWRALSLPVVVGPGGIVVWNEALGEGIATAYAHRVEELERRVGDVPYRECAHATATLLGSRQGGLSRGEASLVSSRNFKKHPS